MKKGNRFVIGLLSAVITFGALTLTMGTDHWERYERFDHHPCWNDRQDDDSGI